MITRLCALLALLCCLMVVIGCASPLAPPPQATPAGTPAPAAVAPCNLPPLVAPTPPARIPAYLELDPATNLHMTGSVQSIDAASYRLTVTGRVGRPLSLTYDDLRCLPKKEVRSELVCPGFFVDTATWAGAPLDAVLEMAGLPVGAAAVRLRSADGYDATLRLVGATLEKEYILAYEWDGQPLPIVHGYPVRAVLPGVTGGSWIKWLVGIEVE